ncbi:acetyl-CoA hydrolase/transferase family protein [Amphritea sp. 2_MG-2023]|jgi:succinyl-CoA:acetate CoA-transferase|uniref:acetyl-CoA hydrolase/transferase family protein n=1 Tax=Amphritea TaxID=515417 RepID=UPI001C069030|nr:MULTISPECIES: acetyl-CoA hydrolase/transferase family protein [Amphritea]MBU2965892.1 acetyl-CoA hydrolase/transferase family protein [Amphritea atlantica]MDO6417982.1 acetyl-CoA hydrolase/transferase family protein [Amphritea sp. 2_MG-2023]MDX2422519.1 acetyl-CoA hydrolase/transferase family protein [Amphritea sp.]
MFSESRVECPILRKKIMSADEAVSFLQDRHTVGMSGFTGAGYPKSIPAALVKKAKALKELGKEFRINLWTGASTAPELDGVLAEVDGINMRLPYQSDPVCRQQINDGVMDYVDMHLSEVSQNAWSGFLGKLDVAVIEVAAIHADGRIVPSSSVGNNKTWVEQADLVILEVNDQQSIKLEGMHDIYYGTALPPNRKPILINSPADRIGEQYLDIPLEKIVAVVETSAPDRNSPFTPPDAISTQIAANIIDFFAHEVKQGRLPKELLPLQSGVGNIPNAVLSGLEQGGYKNLTAYTEVIQDGMLHMLKSGTLSVASATAFSLSPAALEDLNENIDFYREKIILRQQDISNHPEIVRRLGIIAMNGLIEADIYGNVNSTHIMGSRIMNGIGGSGDFARNGSLSIFMTPSVAKNGAISAIVPMASHVDHTEHDVKVIVTEQGLADLRGLSPRQRAKVIIEKCAHPMFKDRLTDYYERACASKRGMHTPHILGEALSWHDNYETKGEM